MPSKFDEAWEEISVFVDSLRYRYALSREDVLDLLRMLKEDIEAEE